MALMKSVPFVIGKMILFNPMTQIMRAAPIK